MDTIPQVAWKMSLEELVLREMQDIEIMVNARGAEAELQVYPTNDGRMKYELYVKEK